MRAAILSLLLALPLFGQYEGFFTIEPIAPTDRSFVVLQIRDVWHDGCTPRNRSITRNGNTILVWYETPKGVGCAQALRPWNDDAPLGVLPAGVYTVMVQVDHWSGVHTRATRTFVVTEGEPAVKYSPRIASTAGGTEIAFPFFCSGTVTIDGVTVPSRVNESCTLIATLPAHAAGPVDLRVTANGRTYDVANAVQYFDPAAPPDPSLFERVLVPVLFHGPGAFGSRWETETVMQANPLPRNVLPDVSAPLRTNTSLHTLFGNRPAGLVLFLPRGQTAFFASHIRDVSRDAWQWGTEIPVVREGDTRQTIVLPNVPFDPRYRLQLRMYGIDGVPMEVTLLAGGKQQWAYLRGPCTAAPCNSSDPAYASADLRQLFPALSGRHTLLLAHTAYQPRRLWAFITVTNDETQHVTVISPQ